MPSKNGKAQAIGKLLLQNNAWSIVERSTLAGNGTRQTALYVLSECPSIHAYYRFDECHERAREALARLIRYYMQDRLKISCDQYKDYMPLVYDAMQKYSFDWEVWIDYMPVYRIKTLTRRRIQARLRHPFYSPFFTPQYGYRPIRDDAGTDATAIPSFHHRHEESSAMHR